VNKNKKCSKSAVTFINSLTARAISCLFSCSFLQSSSDTQQKHTTEMKVEENILYGGDYEKTNNFQSLGHFVISSLRSGGDREALVRETFALFFV
jgi:hypothetical protein